MAQWAKFENFGSEGLNFTISTLDSKKLRSSSGGVKSVIFFSDKDSPVGFPISPRSNPSLLNLWSSTGFRLVMMRLC